MPGRRDVRRPCRSRSRTRRSPAASSPSRARGSDGRRSCGRRCAPCRRAGWGCGSCCTSRGRRSRRPPSTRPTPPAWSSTRSAGRPVTAQWEEVVPVEQDVDPHLLERRRGPPDLGPRRVLRGDLDADAGRARIAHARRGIEVCRDLDVVRRAHRVTTWPLPTTTIPVSVTWKPRARSCSWSMPIWQPSGTTTFLSMIARRI